MIQLKIVRNASQYLALRGVDDVYTKWASLYELVDAGNFDPIPASLCGLKRYVPSIAAGDIPSIATDDVKM